MVAKFAALRTLLSALMTREWESGREINESINIQHAGDYWRGAAAGVTFYLYVYVDVFVVDGDGIRCDINH